MWKLARRRWMAWTGEAESPFDGESPAWLVSLIVHATVFVGLGAVGWGLLPERPTVIEVGTLPEEHELDDDRSVELSAIGEQVVQDEARSLPESLARAVGQLATSSSPEGLNLEIPDSDEPAAGTGVDCGLSPAQLNEPIRLPPASLAVSTTATGVLDRLAVEIRASLEQRSTVVCWVFDQSLSLAGQRQEIAQRLERIAMEVEGSSAPDSHDLLNHVYGYARQVERVTSKPVPEIGRVGPAIRQIPIDESGIEMTFTAVEKAARDAVEMRRRLQPGRVGIMIVLFTDEAGDDQDKADQVAAFCSRAGAQVYVVGVPAPFGQQVVNFKFKEFDPRYADAERWAEVSQGPESRHPEVVRIITGGPLDTPLDSGFGPFSLCKLCLISSGTYFAAHPDRDRRGEVGAEDSAAMAAHLGRFFDPEAMRPYRPVYERDSVLQQEVEANAAKQALVDAAKLTAGRPLHALAQPTMRFVATDQARLIEDLNEAQQRSAGLEPKIDEVLQILAAGRDDRRRIPADEKRWQAAYDLALGRILALKARTLGYNMMLAEAKSMKFSGNRMNTWVLERGELAGAKPLDSRLQKVIDEGRKLLEQVVHDHPGTPWAMIAEEELRTPLTYFWREEYTPPPQPVPVIGPRAAPQRPRDDERRALPGPPPRVLPKKI